MRGILTVALVLFGLSVEAQEVYTLNAGANQVAQLDRNRASRNRQTCARYALTSSCTQAQACTASGAPGGAGCTAAQARQAGVRIYPATQPGREEFLAFDIVLPEIQTGVSSAAADERKAVCSWFVVQTQITKDAECSKWSLDAGCNPCE